MQEAFGIVIFAVVGISVVLAVVSLFFRGKTYDQIGRGGIGDDREIRRPGGRGSESGAVDLGERDDEIRQMLGAHNARAAERGEPQLDVEQELARLTAPAVDPQLREEVRELVIARNSRREARGEPPLDVDAEVERQLREFGG
jgi:hypothetical protein